MTTIVRRSAAGSPKLSTRLLVHWAEQMLSVLGREDAELSVLLTNDRGIQRLNREYRQTDRPTDVLSFHLDSLGTSIEGEWLLGDIVISLDTAQRQAESRRRPLEQEVRWLLAHGILHLVGYDHATADEKRIMVAMTRKLVRTAGEIPSHLAATAKPKVKSPARRVKVPSSSPKPGNRTPPVARQTPKKPHPLPASTARGRKKTRTR